MSVLNDEATLCRWSLDEFILVLPNMEQSEVFYTIDKITRSLNGKKLQTPIGSIDVVSSVGALTVNPITSSENIDEVIALVEGALNEARSSKNDKCVIRHQVDRSA